MYESDWVQNMCRNELTTARRCGNIFIFIDELRSINDGFVFDQLHDDIVGNLGFEACHKGKHSGPCQMPSPDAAGHS